MHSPGVALLAYCVYAWRFVYFQAEVELCSLTSQFEDFVLQFLDRFVLIPITSVLQEGYKI